MELICFLWWVLSPWEALGRAAVCWASLQAVLGPQSHSSPEVGTAAAGKTWPGVANSSGNTKWAMQEEQAGTVNLWHSWMCEIICFYQERGLL